MKKHLQRLGLVNPVVQVWGLPGLGLGCHGGVQEPELCCLLPTRSTGSLSLLPVPYKTGAELCEH